MCNRNSRKRREDCDRKIFEETWSETYLNLVKKKKKQLIGSRHSDNHRQDTKKTIPKH